MRSPKPTDATYVPGLPDQVKVTFDQELTPAVLNLANWEVWFEGGNPAVTAAAIAIDQVQLNLGPFAPINGRSEVSYRPPPFDVTSLADAAPAAAFEAYPVHD